MKNHQLFRNRYRIGSTRLDGWDYGSCAAYFVTIVTKFRVPWFGRIHDGRMELSDIGMVANQCWRDIPAHFPHVSLDTHIIMPNHVHGIVRIKQRIYRKKIDGTPVVGTQNFASLQPRDKFFVANQFGPQSRNLGSIIRGFKIGVTKWAHANDHPDFAWQPRFHHRIVRNIGELERIRRYIAANPSAWKLGDDTGKW